jgi:hypothetical protein
MRSRSITLASAILGGLLLSGSTTLMPISQACAQQAKLSFSEDIAPIFKGWCVSCHQPSGEGFEHSGVDLTTYEGLMTGTKFGPMVVPGEPDVSNLIQLIEGRTSPEIRMPFGHKPLPSCLRQNIWTWIFEGANDN